MKNDSKVSSLKSGVIEYIIEFFQIEDVFLILALSRRIIGHFLNIDCLIFPLNRSIGENTNSLFSRRSVDDIIQESTYSSYVFILESYKNPSPNKNVSSEDDALSSTDSNVSKQSNVPPTNIEASSSLIDGLIS